MGGGGTLHTAARAQLVEQVIRPALDQGVVVVCDRFVDSSLAYQGIAQHWCWTRCSSGTIATRGVLPDRTFGLVLPVEEARPRLHGKRDRIEREGRAFLERVADAYLRSAEAFPERIVTVDATLPKAQVADQVRGELRALA